MGVWVYVCVVGWWICYYTFYCFVIIVIAMPLWDMFYFSCLLLCKTQFLRHEMCSVNKVAFFAFVVLDLKLLFGPYVLFLPFSAYSVISCCFMPVYFTVCLFSLLHWNLLYLNPVLLTCPSCQSYSVFLVFTPVSFSPSFVYWPFFPSIFVDTSAFPCTKPFLSH